MKVQDWKFSKTKRQFIDGSGFAAKVPAEKGRKTWVNYGPEDVMKREFTG